MRLENLYPNFGAMSPAEQVLFIADYRERRALDMLKPANLKKRKSSSSTKKKASASLTDEEKNVMKMLGLTRKQMLDLRASIQTDEQVVDDEEDMTDLLNESCFGEEEE